MQLTLLVTGVLLSRALGPEDRGHMALLTLVSAVAWQLGGLGIPLALTYATSRAPEASARIVASLRRAVIYQTVVASLVAAVVLVLLTAGKPGYVQLGALMTVFAVVPEVYQRCGLGVLQGLRRFRSFNLWRIAPNASFAAVAGGFFLAGVTSFAAYAAAWAASRSIFALATQQAARRAAHEAETGHGAPPVPKDIMKFGRRALFGGSPPVETFRIDQSIVALFLAPTALGFYVTALAFTNLPRFVAQSFALVSTPTVARQPSHQQARRSMWIFFWVSMPFYLAISVPLWIAAPELARFFFGAEFAEAGGISRILLVATVLFCARRVLADSARVLGHRQRRRDHGADFGDPAVRPLRPGVGRRRRRLCARRLLIDRARGSGRRAPPIRSQAGSGRLDGDRVSTPPAGRRRQSESSPHDRDDRLAQVPAAASPAAGDVPPPRGLPARRLPGLLPALGEHVAAIHAGRGPGHQSDYENIRDDPARRPAVEGARPAPGRWARDQEPRAS